jgi:integration host factor subunit beta
MTKAELVEKVSNRVKLTKKEAEAVVNAITQSISDSLAEGSKVEIRGFGSFRIRDRKARTAYNPRSRVEVKVPVKKVPFSNPGIT